MYPNVTHYCNVTYKNVHFTLRYTIVDISTMYIYIYTKDNEMQYELASARAVLKKTTPLLFTACNVHVRYII